MNLAINTDFNGGLGNPEPRLQAIAAAGFTHLHWCHQWCTDFLYGKAEIAAIAGWLKQYGLHLLDIHGSAGVEKCWFSAVEYQRRAGVELVANRLEMWAELGGTGSLMMHIPNFSAFTQPEDRPRIRQQVEALKRSLDELMPRMEQLHARIALENMWADDFVILKEMLALYPAERVGICYDSGHANSAALPGLASMETCKDRLMALHLHDNDGQGDLHQPPFMNTVDWSRLAELIRTSAYPRQISFELSMSNTPFYDPQQEDHQPPEAIAAFLADAYERCVRFARMVHPQQN